MATFTVRSSRQRTIESDEEEGRGSVFPSPVQSSMTGDYDIPPEKTRQVVGTILQRNMSSVDLVSTTDQPSISATPVSFKDHSPVAGSLKSMTRLKPSPPVSECSETTPLMIGPSSTATSDSGVVINECHEMSIEPKLMSKQTQCRRQCRILSVIVLLVVPAVLLAVIVTVVIEYRPLNNHKSNAVIRNENDTIIAVQVNSKYTRRVSLQLTNEGRQPLHIVHFYSAACDKLTSHAATVHSSPQLNIDGAVKIMFPTYLVTGSQINIDSFVLNASKLTVQIELYIFNSLKMASNFATHLDKRAYETTIYISGPGVQNTSTFTNYTIPSTDYYFVVVDTTDPILAQFDITVHEEVYKGTDYKEVCIIEGSDNCVVSYDDSSPYHDKQECILAHAEYERDVQWVEADIQVTQYPRRNTETAIVVLSSVGVFCFVLLSVIIFCGFLCLCKSMQRKHGYKNI